MAHLEDHARTRAAAAGVLAYLERSVGLTFVLFLSGAIIAVGFLALLIFWLEGTRSAGIWGTAAYLAICPWEIAFLTFMNRRLKHDPPPEMGIVALEQPRYPILTRPIVGVWWLGHFLFSVLALRWLLEDYEANLKVSRAALAIISFVVRFGAGAAGNFFLLLAGAAIWRNPRWLAFIWRSRFLIDAAAAFVPWSFPVQHL